MYIYIYIHTHDFKILLQKPSRASQRQALDSYSNTEKQDSEIERAPNMFIMKYKSNKK